MVGRIDKQRLINYVQVTMLAPLSVARVLFENVGVGVHREMKPLIGVG